jgi:hypothetical protein
MRTRFTSNTLLAAVAALGLGIAPALAAGPSNSNGYEFPDFWGDAPAQQTTTAHAPNQAGGASVGTYDTQTSHGTWLFPPNPYSGANG